jgi:hypothetical protein
VLVYVFLALAPLPLYAQETGAISGKVTATDGSTLPGATVEARADVLPGPRVTVTGADGEYRLPALPPGGYTVKFSLSGMQSVTRTADVQLGQDTVVDTKLAVQGVTETVNVTAEVTYIDRETATLANGLSSEQIKNVPVGQEYRDLIKLIPAVEYTQDSVRGPSAGGSGQDNVYQFDGVNVTLPLFGTLSAEPAAHDIAQISIIKGGARAVDFVRSGGFAVDSVSKSGSNRYSGQLSYQFQNPSMAAKLTSGSLSKYDQTRTWTDLNGGGPIAPDHLFFYASYYRPDLSRDNQANLYGSLPQYTSTRNEGFGKVTYTPVHSVLLNFSYRDSHRLDTSAVFASNASSTTGTGNEAWLKIGNAEGSWVVNSKSLVSFKYTHFTNLTQGRPDNVANVSLSTAVGTQLNLGGLATQGLLSVPAPIAGQAAYDAFIQPLINQYGYLQNGAPVGGGTVGYGTTFDNDNFFRDAGQVSYDYAIVGKMMRHNLHAGYQQYVDSEDLTRSSNGWGSITVPGGRLSFQGTPIFYEASFQQQTTGFARAVPTIHSEYRSLDFELNDAISWQKMSFNVGAVLSRDTLYGQGLKEDPSTLSGYSLSPGTKYKMYVIPFSKMIQPRVSGTYAYGARGTFYASYAKYSPPASSLPRAASWDRNLATTINAYFDANGVLFGSDSVASSSGKLFVPNMTPRTIQEYLVGTSRQITAHWSGRLYWRYRHGTHFWEDTNNTARVAFNPPPGIPQTLYIPDLDARRAQIGSGSTYVITDLDGSFTKYHEVTAESDYRAGKLFVRGSYSWTHYYGNFDQDNSTIGNDANIFIGSSFIGDGAGRQLWDNKLGTLRGDRPFMLKLYGYYILGWHATAGAYAVAQSGQPWEAWSYEPYKSLTTSVSDTARFAEPAGDRRTPMHEQLDLNYTQNVPFARKYNVQVAADLFNVFNKQTGYNYDPSVHSSTFGLPRSYFLPRYFQVAVRIQFQ